MKCPFSGKPCLLPKEIFVTEMKDDVVTNLHLCRCCGDQYIKDLADSEIVTKLNSISADNGVVKSNQLIKLNETEPVVEPMDHKVPTSVITMRQILQLERKLEEAIKREDYESAANLKEVLSDLRDSLLSVSEQDKLEEENDAIDDDNIGSN